MSLPDRQYITKRELGEELHTLAAGVDWAMKKQKFKYLTFSRGKRKGWLIRKEDAEALLKIYQESNEPI